MELKLYDTLTREKRVFTPLDPAHVRMYVCGPTVYDFAHIGNARPVIVFDALFRLLRHLAKQGVWDGGRGETSITYVRNITDVDDKINARAAELGISINDLTKRTYDEFKRDVAALGCLPPTFEPRATEYIRRTDGKLDMVSLIERLVRSEHAYIAEEHVLFRVPSMRDYGQLSKRSLDEMIAGARVEVAPYKQNPMDFVLWKPSDERQANYALPKWRSPCDIVTPGRPGWHIECSAMSGALLGETFDIHGGGIDLIFPHHENEIAQSRCAFHTPIMAKYWMHNGFLQVEGKKMAKSEGNFITIRELLNQRPNNSWWGEILRLNMLRTHYRQPIDWTDRNLVDTEIMYAHLLRAASHGSKSRARVSPAVIRALSDDLNSPAAITELLALAKRAHSLNGNDNPADAADELVGSLQLLGFDQAIAKVPESRGVREDILLAMAEAELKEAGFDVPKILALVDDRNAARKAKNFNEADRIRDELEAMGIELEDYRGGATIPKVKR
jgi:cysteinyl-tRNA synthetase